MANLTAAQLANMRKSLRTEWNTAIDFAKPIINAVFQALEDEYERTASETRQGFKLAAAADITTAASPKVFSNVEKKKIGRAYLGVKFNLEAS